MDRAHTWYRTWVGLLVVLLLLFPGQGGVTLEDLRNDPKLTPKRFASQFSDFEYKYGAEVQKPAVFLTTKVGDCDDYATLAASVLGEKSFKTHLIAVRMPGLVTHVVCYVEEEKGYLDYNLRSYLSKIQHCSPTMREIAGKVAKSFDANWTSASEFTFTNGVKRLVATLAKTDPPAQDLPLGAMGPVRRIDF